MKRATLMLAALILLLGGVEQAKAGSLILGQPADTGTGNFIPFGGEYNGTYQQVYSSSAFSGPITITGLEFFNTEYNSGATQTPSGTYTIDFSTTSKGPTTLSTTFANNVGSGDTTVFSGSLSQPWAFGDTLNITLSTPFTYNPTNGNLLLQVVGSGTSGGNIYFDVTSNTSIMNRVYYNSTRGINVTGLDLGVSGNFGLVTGFQFQEVSAVPEPSTLALLGTGAVCSFGYGWRRRRRRA